MSSDPPAVNLVNATPFTLTTVNTPVVVTGINVRQIDIATGIITQAIGLTATDIPVENIEFHVRQIRIWNTTTSATPTNNVISMNVYDWRYPFQSGSASTAQYTRPVYTKEDTGGRMTYAKLQYNAKSANKSAVHNGSGTSNLYSVYGAATATITMHVTGSYRFRLPTPVPALFNPDIFGTRLNRPQLQESINEENLPTMAESAPKQLGFRDPEDDNDLHTL
jgi:hypothetical protein